MGGLTEPKIIVNGRELTGGEAMTVRVAIEAFATDLVENGLGKDQTGKDICSGYLRNINTIRDKMYLRDQDGIWQVRN